MTFIKSTTLLRTTLLALLPLTAAAGCATEAMEDFAPKDDKSDRWNSANDPRNMGQDYVYNWEELNVPDLQAGASDITPWPDSYWPMKDDGYNDRWQPGKLSPMELYDKVFNNWTPSMGFEDYLDLTRFSSPGTAYDAEYYDELGPATNWAHEGGNKRARVLTAPDGTPLWDEESEEDYVDWGGLQGWFGHCHAWAPAAFMYPEPQHAVTYQGETFEVADIKALANATLEGGRSKFLGGRCNAEEAERDEYGRIIATECRDTNAGAFHVVVLNRMGIRKASFVMDATYDSEVWNQPVRDYTINKQEEIDVAKALELVKRTDVTEWPYSDAERFVHVKMDFRYVVEGNASATPYLDRIDAYTRSHDYNYILELEADGTIIGGEWIDDAPHPDFIWAPYGTNDVGPQWGTKVIRKADVEELVKLSREDAQAEPTDGTAYESTPNSDIPDNDSGGVRDSINVADSTIIAALSVNVNITHTYRGDLTVSLVHNGERVTLVANEGGSEDDIVKSFTVSDFDGQSAQGEWLLHVVDSANIDIGTLNSWTLNVSE